MNRLSTRYGRHMREAQPTALEALDSAVRYGFVVGLDSRGTRPGLSVPYVLFDACEPSSTAMRPYRPLSRETAMTPPFASSSTNATTDSVDLFIERFSESRS